MTGLALRRAAQAAALLLVMSFAVFCLIGLMPGDPVDLMMAGNPNLKPDDIARLRSIDISIVANTPEGSGVCGQAFRDRQVCVSNDFLNDPRSLPWRAGAEAARVGAAAALPLTCNGHSVGV